MPAPLTGSCLCGAIRFTVSAPVADLRACHCTSCQKASGAGGSVNAVMPSSAFRITQGTPKRYDAKADSGRTLYRYFCGDCGSPIYSQRATGHNNMIVVRAGLFDRKDGSMKIKTNIWTKSAAPWAHFDPDSQQVPGQPS
jgi:hypothetical protein